MGMVNVGWIVDPQKKLTRVIKTTVGKSVQRNVRKGSKVVFELLKYCTQHQLLPKLLLRGEKTSTQENKDSDITEPAPAQREQQPINTTPEPATAKEAKVDAQGEHSSEQAHPILTALVIQSSKEEPPVKKVKVIMPDFTISSPTPLKSIMPQGIKPPIIINNIPLDQFTSSLFSTSSSEFSLTPPPKITDKGKSKATKEDSVKQLIPLMDEGGSTPKLPNLQQFSTSEVQMTIGEAKAQMEEINRLEFLKAEKEKTEKRLKVLTPEELEAQEAELAAYEAKREKMLEEFNHYITFRADPLPITKISYRVNNSTKEAYIRIIRDNQPLNLIVYDRFVLKMLGFSEWLEVHALASKVKSKSNDLLLKNLKAKFQWLKTQARKLGIPPPPQLTTFGLTALEKKRKRSSELIKEVFVKEDIVVDGMHRNLVPPLGVVPSEGKCINAIKVDSKYADKMYPSNKGLAECKALASNLKRIQVKDIVKEVEDYLKTYSSAGMDIS
ncbi:hypothetical protein Tco_1103739 [Tanacetum coccineum]